MPEILAALLIAAASNPSSAAAKVDAGAPPETVSGKAPDRQPLPPELTSDGLRDELRRAARERKTQTAKLSDERNKLSTERGELEQMARDLEGARQSLRAETQDLNKQIKKRPSSSSTSATAAAAGGGADGTTGGKAPAGPLDVVAKTLKNMRPDQAAQVLIRVDRSLAVGVLGHMRPSDAGAVLEKMKPEQAAQFIAALAGEGHGGEQRHE